MVLVDGEVSGTWRQRMRGRRLEVTVDPFAAVPGRLREHLDVEADALGQLRGVPDIALRVVGEG